MMIRTLSEENAMFTVNAFTHFVNGFAALHRNDAHNARRGQPSELKEGASWPERARRRAS